MAMEKDYYKNATLPLYSVNQLSVTNNTATSPSIINGLIEPVSDSFSGSSINELIQRPSISWQETIYSDIPGNGYFHHAYYPYFVVNEFVYKKTIGGGQSTIITGTNTLSGNGSKLSPIRNTQTNIDQLIYVEGGTGKLWSINMSTDVATFQSGAPTPANPFVAQMDGYLFVNKLGTDEIYNSAVNDVSSWNLSVNLIRSSATFGNITALTEYKNYIIAFKETSAEFFYDAALTGTSPLQRQDSFRMTVGCTKPWCIAKGDDSLFWVGRGANGNTDSVYIMTGDSASRISTPLIDQLLAANNYLDSSISGRLVHINGYSFYVLSFSNGVTWAYCAETKLWAQWSVYNESIDFKFNANISLNTIGPYFYSSANDKLQVLAFDSTVNNQDTLSGGTSPIVISITTPYVDFGTVKRKIVTLLRLQGSIHPGYNVRVKWTDDGDTTFSSQHTFPIGANPIIRNLGQTRRRKFVFEFVNTQDINNPSIVSSTNLPRIRLEGIEVEYREGQS